MDVVGDRTDMNVLERQRARMKWQQGELHQEDSYFNRNEFALYSAPAHSPQFQSLVNGDLGLNQLVTPTLKVDSGLESGWPEYKCVGDVLGFGSCGFGNGNGSAIEVNYGVPVATNCPPAAAVTKSELEVPVPMADTRGRESVLPEKLSSAAGRESFKKRKAGHTQNPKMLAENDTKEKKIKGCAEEGESKITEQSSNNNRETSADTSKASEVQKPDYIHVRARRGQATDSHSLAERVRREKISERMKYLQDLVPGCNKITGKAGMLDEIINYVQSLQRQVEFLSMKLAAMNPSLDFNIDNFFAKEVFPACGSNISTIGGVSSEMPNPAYHQFNPLQQLVSCCGLEMGTNAPDMTLRRAISAPVSIPETFLDSSCFNQIQNSTWDTDLQNLYGVEFHQGRSTPFPSQQFIGSIEASNLKMEM